MQNIVKKHNFFAKIFGKYSINAYLCTRNQDTIEISRGTMARLALHV